MTRFGPKLTRRQAIRSLAGGGLLLPGILSEMLQASTAEASSLDPLAPKRPHFAPKAKRVIFLFMTGGVSHIDTFDPKIELTKRHLQEFSRSGEHESAMSSGKRYYVKSPFAFIKAGQGGADICIEWLHLKDGLDDSCSFRGA